MLEDVVDLFVNGGMSAGAIARKKGVPLHKVKSILKKCGVGAKDRKAPLRRAEKGSVNVRAWHSAAAAGGGFKCGACGGLTSVYDSRPFNHERFGSGVLRTRVCAQRCGGSERAESFEAPLSDLDRAVDRLAAKRVHELVAKARRAR